MKLLYRYLRNYRGLIALALTLAAINQVFSLLDPLIFRHVIDEYATRFSEYSTGEFFRGVSLLLAAAVGVAFVSRVAKNFQDYYINVITQRLGAQLYSDGIRHSLELPYSVFEDQRSGETLGRLQKVRTDVERLISTAINVLFTSLVGIIFVMMYAFSVHWLIAPAYFLTVPVLRGAELRTEQAHQSDSESNRCRNDGACRVDDRVAAEHRAGEESRPRAAGNQSAERHDAKDPEARAQESALPAESQLHPGHVRQLPANEHHVPDALPDLHARDHGGAVLLALHLLVLHLRSAAGAGEHHQHLPRDGSVAQRLRTDSRDPEGAEARKPHADARPANARIRARQLSAPVGLVSRRERYFVSDGAWGDHCLRRAIRRGEDNAGEAAGRSLSAPFGRDLLQRHPRRRDRSRRPARADWIRHAGHAALLRHDPREPAVRPAISFRRRVPGRA